METGRSFQRFYLVYTKIILYNRHVFTGELIFIIRRQKITWAVFLVLHKRKIVYWNCFTEWITIHIWEQDAEEWRLTERGAFAERYIILKILHFVQSLSGMWKRWKEIWE